MDYPQKIETTSVQVLGDELCIYDLATKRVHALNVTAARVWELCDGKHSVADIASALSAEFNVTDATALAELTLQELDKAQLLVPRTAPQHSGVRLSRRHVLVGATAVLVPVVVSMVAPLPAAAQTGIPTSTQTSTSTQTATNTGTATDTGTATSSATASNTPTDTTTATASNTPTDTSTPTASNTPTDTSTSTATSTPSDTPTWTTTSTPSDTPTWTTTSTPSSTPTDTSTSTPSSTPTSTSTNTALPPP